MFLQFRVIYSKYIIFLISLFSVVRAAATPEIDADEVMRNQFIAQLDAISPDSFNIQEEVRYRWAKVDFIDNRANGKFLCPSSGENSWFPGDHGYSWGNKFIRGLEIIGRSTSLPNISFHLAATDVVGPPVQSIVFTANKRKGDNTKNIILTHPCFFDDLEAYRSRFEECKRARKVWEDKGFTFKQKAKIAFSRVSHTHPSGFDALKQQRFRACLLSCMYPELLDCKYVNLPAAQNSYFGFLSTIATGTFVSIENQTKYAYHLCLDGWAGSWILGGRLTEGMLLGNLCFNPSAYEMYFESVLKPFVHYIPVAPDLSDLLTQINWARDNPEKAEEIAENGRLFAEQFLHPDRVLEHFIFQIREIAKRQQFNGVSILPRLSYSASIPRWKTVVSDIDSLLQKKLVQRFSDASVQVIQQLSKEKIDSLLDRSGVFGFLQDKKHLGVIRLTSCHAQHAFGISEISSTFGNWKKWFEQDGVLFLSRSWGDVYFVLDKFTVLNGDNVLIFGYNPAGENLSLMSSSFPYILFQT